MPRMTYLHPLKATCFVISVLCIAFPSTWNSLISLVQLLSICVSFKTHLKGHLLYGGIGDLPWPCSHLVKVEAVRVPTTPVQTSVVAPVTMNCSLLHPFQSSTSQTVCFWQARTVNCSFLLSQILRSDMIGYLVRLS